MFGMFCLSLWRIAVWWQFHYHRQSLIISNFIAMNQPVYIRDTKCCVGVWFPYAINFQTNNHFLIAIFVWFSCNISNKHDCQDILGLWKKACVSCYIDSIVAVFYLSTTIYSSFYQLRMFMITWYTQEHEFVVFFCLFLFFRTMMSVNFNKFIQKKQTILLLVIADTFRLKNERSHIPSVCKACFAKFQHLFHSTRCLRISLKW